MPENLLPILEVIVRPFVYFQDRKVKRRNQVRNLDGAPYDSKPARLNIGLRRPITPPLQRSSPISLLRAKPKHHDQAGSAFFTKLPVELRLMIWQLCFAETVHVYWCNGHMGGYRCVQPLSEGPDFGDHIACYKIARPVETKGKAREMRSRIALILTCRRM